MTDQPRSDQPDGDRGDLWFPRTWMLADDRPGNVNQARGVAEALGAPFIVKTIDYSPLARLPNRLLPTDLSGLSSAGRAVLVPPWPDLVIGAGRRTAPVGRWLKRQRPSTCLVQLMWPGSADLFDLIAVPEHDRVPDHPAVMRTLGTPHRLTPALLAKAAAELRLRLSELPRPHVACLVGGGSRHAPVTPDDMRKLAEGASALARERGGSLLVTTSRRTGDACTDALAAALDGPHRLHRWQPAGANPYLGFLGSADAVVVTADSASMCTEACATGRPVFLYRPARGAPSKFGRLHDRLRQAGCLRPLGSPWFEVAAPLPNPAIAIAEAIRGLLRQPRDGAAMVFRSSAP